MTKIYYDSEFTGLHKDTTLISIGLISECGTKTFYAEFLDYDKSQVDDWIQNNVIDNLLFNKHIKKSSSGFLNFICDKREGIESFVDPDVRKVECLFNKKGVLGYLKKWFEQFDEVEIWSDACAYDWVLFCDLFGGAFQIPENIYYIPFDLSTKFRENGIDPDINREEFAFGDKKDDYADNKHNALWDAQVIRLCDMKIESH